MGHGYTIRVLHEYIEFQTTPLEFVDSNSNSVISNFCVITNIFDEVWPRSAFGDTWEQILDNKRRLGQPLFTAAIRSGLIYMITVQVCEKIDPFCAHMDNGSSSKGTSACSSMKNKHSRVI